MLVVSSANALHKGAKMIERKILKKLSVRFKLYSLIAVLGVASVIASLGVPQSANAAIGSVSSYSVPLDGEYLSNNVALGPDNNIWYTASGPTINTSVGKVSPSGIYTQYGNRTANSRSPETIITGPDGNIWYTEQYFTGSIEHFRFVKLNTSGQVLGQYNVPGGRSIQSLAIGSDGNIWFSESNIIGKITTDGVITEGITSGLNVTAGPDGNIWFSYASITSSSARGVGKVSMNGVSTRYQVPSLDREGSDIVAGPDGNMWITSAEQNKILKMTTLGVTLQSYVMPTANSGPTDITVGNDGALWFTQTKGFGQYGRDGQVGRITTSGLVTEYPVTGGKLSYASQIVAGSDNAVWFTTDTKIYKLATDLSAQSIVFNSVVPGQVNSESDEYKPVASSTSGLPVSITVDPSSSDVCSIDGTGSISFLNPGTCLIDANQSGNADYKPAAQIQQSIEVLPIKNDLAVTSSCPDTLALGSNFGCTFTVINNGPAPANDVYFNLVFPSAFSNVFVSDGTLNGQTVSKSIASINAGGSSSIVINAQASAKGKFRINASAVQTGYDIDNGNNIITNKISVTN